MLAPLSPLKCKALACMNVTFVLWDGRIGGAERLAVRLAAEFWSHGVGASVLFLGSDDQLAPELNAAGVPGAHLRFRSGSDALRYPRRFVSAIHAQAADVVILPDFGYLAVALRIGGFTGAVIGVEHGNLAELMCGANAKVNRTLKTKLLVSRISGVPAHDAEVVVSSFMESLSRRVRVHGKRLVQIPNGVPMCSPAPPPPMCTNVLKLAFAGRLIRGKGLDVLLRAVGVLRSQGCPVELEIAGDGPIRPQLEQLARRTGVDGVVTFLGWTQDIGAFWNRNHVAVAPNDTVVESFCLSVAEAMSHSRPAIVTSLGALPELVVARVTGTVVTPGDADSIAAAARGYLENPRELELHGIGARERAESIYALDRCATAYLQLASELAAQRGALRR